MSARPVTEYRRTVLQRHRAAFDIHSEAATEIERNLVGQHTFPTHVEMVIHMLAIQGLKAHAAVSLLSQHGLMEESATSCRRLMELAVQAIFIGQESDEVLRRRRAGQYAAYLWRQLPTKAKQKLPAELRARWTSLGRGYGRFIKRKHGWGPAFSEMFKECGLLDLYETDYALLSSITHGTADAQVFQFSGGEVRVHDDRFASTLLVYASRYFLALTDPWRTVFAVDASAALQRVGERLESWDFAASGRPPAAS